MSEAWRQYSTAPPAGAVLCASDDVAEGAARCVVVQSDAGSFPVLLLRAGGRVKAYVNACPHQYLPLDYRSDSILSADGSRLLCSAHGAVFDSATGHSLTGEGGDGLDSIPVVESHGVIRIDG